MGKYLDMVRRLEQERDESLGGEVVSLEADVLGSMEDGAVFADLLTNLEREIYDDLMDTAQSKFEHDKKTAEGVAGRWIAKHCRPLQAQQAAKDFKRYGYVKIFASVLGGPVYLIKHKGVAGRVPDRSLPVYTPEDIEAINGLSPEKTLTLLEALMVFGGSITKKTKKVCKKVI